MEIKHFSLSEVKADADARTIEGWASTFGNVDNQKDIVLPGAFTKTIQGRVPKIKMLWQHRQDQPVGVWEEAREEAKGLFLKGRILDTTLGNDVHKLALAGAIDSLSIGYSPKNYEIDRKTGIRSLKEVELFEVSLVTFPANDRATLTAVKSENGAFMTEREFEDFLRDVGKLSQKEAKIVLSQGYKSLLAHRDGGDQTHIPAKLADLLTQFKL